MQLKKPTIRVFAASVMLVASQTIWAEDSGAFSLGTGYNYSSGNYGTSTTTDITSIPLIATYDKGPWTMRLTVPYIRITGASDVLPGVGRARASAAPTVSTQSGLGDVVASGTYNFFNDAASQFGADITCKIKFGTADKDKNFGTGKNDYGTQLDVYKKIDRCTLFSGLRYTVFGSSTDIPLHNVWNAGVGTSYKFTDKNSAGVAYDYRQKASDTGFAQSELTAYVVHKFDKTWKAQAYLLKGFSDGSPDWGAGASVGYAF